MINFCAGAVSRPSFMHRQSASRCYYAEPPFQSASDAGSAIDGRRRGNWCAAAALPQPYVCALSPRAVCTLYRTVLATTVDPANDLWLHGRLFFELFMMLCGSWTCRVAVQSAPRHMGCMGCVRSCQIVYMRSVSVLRCSVELGSDLGLSGHVKLMYKRKVSSPWRVAIV